jgi:prepilin-type N-terminal cleavage/methylation domain-containing protein
LIPRHPRATVKSLLIREEDSDRRRPPPLSAAAAKLGAASPSMAISIPHPAGAPARIARGRPSRGAANGPGAKPRAGAVVAAAGARRRRGFTLVEVSVALWILLVALLSGIALVLQQPRVVRRIDAERQAVAVMEWTLEEMRAGLIPLQSTPDVGWTVSSFVVGSPAPDLKVAVAVVPAPTPGLYQVSLTARYTVYGRLARRRLQTMFWRPGGGPP